MDLATIEVLPEDWGDIVSKYPSNSPKLKNYDFTAGTKNMDTDNIGSIAKRKGYVNYSSIPTPAKDQFEAIFSDGVHHLLTVDSGNLRYSSGDGQETLVTAGYTATLNFEFATMKDRVYFGNTATAQVYDRTTSYGGVAYTAPKTKIMGAQAPTVAPTAGAPTAGGNVPNGAHTYKITFVYYGSEESNGSPASGAQTAGAGNNTIPLTAIQIGGYGVTSRKIYRDNNDGVWVHLATLSDNTTTTYTDTLSVGATPTPIPTDNGVPPAFGLITVWLDRLWISKISGEPYTLYYSDAGLPDIFPANNRRICNQQDPINGHIVYRGRLIVWNRNSMGYIEGSTPDTFQYIDIQGSVGCVDNRTIQIRVVNGVPVLVWLSDKGFYSYDGNSIDYISDPLEDLVNFNIQQALLQRGRNSQTTQTDFTNGTPSNGISLTENPGFITTRGYSDGSSTAGTNPRRTWDDSTDWEGGSSKQNVITMAADNLLKNLTRFAPTLASGTRNGTIINGTDLKITTVSNFTGEANPFSHSTTIGTTPSVATKLAIAIIPVRTGTLTNFTFVGLSTFGGTTTKTIASDASDEPGGTIGGIGITLTGGVKYWLIVSNSSGFDNTNSSTEQLSGDKSMLFRGGWNDVSTAWQVSYSFCPNPISKSGQWLSPIHDSGSAYVTATLQVTHTGTYTGGSFCAGAYTLGSTTRLEGSNDSAFVGGAEIFEDFSNVNGAQSYTISGKRYWRIRITLTTTDNRATPVVGTPILTFNQTGTWVSEVIDTTADVTVYNSLTVLSTTPAGTSVTVTVASSANGITFPDGFVAFGSVVVRRYIKIQLVLSSTSDDITSPTVSSINLAWTIVANLISSIIDTAVTPPAGWDIFQALVAASGSGVTFEMRSATTSGGIPAATFFTITNGDFPNVVTPLQFVQWKATITATDNSVPSIDSVTVNWFIGNTTNIRPASIFFGGRYYVSLAEFDQTYNNLLIVIDLKGKWRIYRDLNVATFSLFFNNPYAGLATAGSIVKFLQGNTDGGNDIELDVRTPAHVFNTVRNNNSNRYKVVHKFFLEGRNTGATYQIFFSVDDGATFTAMLDDTGASSFTTSSDGSSFYRRFQAMHADNVLVSGRTIMYRILNNDDQEVEIDGYKAQAFVRQGEPVVTG